LIALVAFGQQRAGRFRSAARAAPAGITANESTGQVFVVRAPHSMLIKIS
jgi:hypothetical protein